MSQEKTKVYIYTRVSTAMQIDGYSPDAQKARMKAYADFNDYQIIGEYEDAGKSGKSIEGRASFCRMMEYGRNYQTYKPIQDEYRQIRWKGKQEKFAEARRAELTLWDAANRYLHAHLPEGVKTLPISAWEKEYTALKAQREAEYETLKDTRAEVAELQKIRKCVDIALRADQPAQTQSRTKRQEQER